MIIATRNEDELWFSSKVYKAALTLSIMWMNSTSKEERGSFKKEGKEEQY